MKSRKPTATRSFYTYRCGVLCAIVVITRNVITCVIMVTSLQWMTWAVTTRWLVRRTFIHPSCDSTSWRWRMTSESRSDRETFWGFSSSGTTRWRGPPCRVLSPLNATSSHGEWRRTRWRLERHWCSTWRTAVTITAVVSTRSLPFSVSLARYSSFYRAMHMHKRGICRHAVCPSVCLYHRHTIHPF